MTENLQDSKKIQLFYRSDSGARNFRREIRKILLLSTQFDVQTWIVVPDVTYSHSKAARQDVLLSVREQVRVPPPQPSPASGGESDGPCLESPFPLGRRCDGAVLAVSSLASVSSMIR